MSITEKLKTKYQSFQKDKHFFEILSGSIWSFGSKIMAVILGLVLNLLITRLYNVEAMGTFALVNSLITIMGIIALMGTNTVTLKLIPEYTTKYSSKVAIAIYWKIFGIVSIISILVSFFTYYFSEIIAETIFNEPNISSMFVLASILIVPYSLSTLNSSAFRAFKQIKYYVLYQVLNPLFKVIALLILSFFSFDENNPVYALFAGIILLSLFTSFILKLKTKQLARNDELSLRNYQLSTISIISLSFPMFLTASMHIVMSQTDIVMLGAMESVVLVGIYAIAVKLSALTSFILGTVNTMAAPKFSELYHSGDMKSLKSVTQKSSKMMFFSTLPIVLIFILFGKLFLGIFGEEYEVAYITLLILVIGQFVNAFVGPVGFFLNMTGHQKGLNKMVVFAAIINIMLNYSLIPMYGINGAAIATAISLSSWNILAAIYIKRKFGFYINYDFKNKETTL